MLYSAEFVPGSLSEQSHYFIEINMLGNSVGIQYAPATCDIVNAEEPSGAPLDASFAAQINHIYHCPSEVVPDVTKPPEVYLVTARSAIPTADAIRGFYQEMGLKCPPVGYITADRDLAFKYIKQPSDQSKANLDKEAARLSSTLKDAHHVCVIDQYVQSGRTLQYAGYILDYAEVQHTSAIRGRWYHQAFESDRLDPNLVTSRHASLMLNIGHKACRQLAVSS